jgi:hypothetical protein
MTDVTDVGTHFENDSGNGYVVCDGAFLPNGTPIGGGVTLPIVAPDYPAPVIITAGNGTIAMGSSDATNGGGVGLYGGVITGQDPFDDAPVLFINGNSGSGVQGGNVALTAGPGSITGGGIRIYSGASVAGTAGHINITGANSNFGLGGIINITGGNSISGNAGSLIFQGGNVTGNATGNGGDAQLNAGGGFNAGGSAIMQAGADQFGHTAGYISVGGNGGGYGGTASLQAGNGDTLDGGSVQIFAGGSLSGVGGNASVIAGSSQGSALGGQLSLYSGDGGATGGDAGIVAIRSGSGQAANANGGDLLLIVGVKNGSGNNGALSMGTFDGDTLTWKILGNLLPTADPHVLGQIWSNAGVLTMSAG